MWGSIIGAALGAGGSILGGAMSSAGQASANAQNAQLAREQMAFQERMSNTAYQRAMEDMRRAGLNPILAYQKGGASSPGGAMAVMQNAEAAMGEGVAKATTSAKEGASALPLINLTKAQADNQSSQVPLNAELTSKAATDKWTSAALGEKYKNEAVVAHEQARNAFVQNKILENQVIESGHSAAIRGLEKSKFEQHGTGVLANTTDTVFRALDDISSKAQKVGGEVGRDIMKWVDKIKEGYQTNSKR